MVLSRKALRERINFYETYFRSCAEYSRFFLLSPLMLIIALLVRFKIGSPVLFRQVRPGLHGKPFTLYKFRTMTDQRDERGETRHYRVGAFSFVNKDVPEHAAVAGVPARRIKTGKC